MFDDNHNNQFDGEFNEVEPENNSPESRDPKNGNGLGKVFVTALVAGLLGGGISVGGYVYYQIIIRRYRTRLKIPKARRRQATSKSTSEHKLQKHSRKSKEPLFQLKHIQIRLPIPIRLKTCLATAARLKLRPAKALASSTRRTGTLHLS